MEENSEFVLKPHHVDTRGLRRSQVLQALMNGVTYNTGTFDHAGGPMLGMMSRMVYITEEAAAEHVLDHIGTDWEGKVRCSYDYVDACCIKVNASDEDQFDARLYDRDHGDGQAARLVAALRLGSL